MLGYMCGEGDIMLIVEAHNLWIVGVNYGQVLGREHNCEDDVSCAFESIISSVVG